MRPGKREPGNTDLSDADLTGADLGGANLAGATLDGADLQGSNLAGIRWKDIASVQGADIFQVKNAPDGFLGWAARRGATASKTSNSQETPEPKKKH